jgi:hypothetical protein
VEAEAKIVRGMRDQRRCCIATIGDGAAVDPQLYTNLYGSIIIWLGEQRLKSARVSLSGVLWCTAPRHRQLELSKHATHTQLHTRVHTDEEDKRAPKPFSSARSVYYQQSEVRAKLSSSKGGFGDKPQSLEDKASKVRAC